jgi:pimeloyl-ACP methyl ester carboxylesterase
VIVLPGFGAGDGSTAALRSYLRVQGHRASGWRLGTNRGDVAKLLPRVTERVERVARSAGGPVALVGWSLGGVLARETARDRPDLVSRVITLGSPVIGGPKYTAVAAFYRSQGIDLDAIEAEVAARDATPIRTPITAIYSRSDGVVSWRACIDGRNPAVEHVEVMTSHLGLGFSPEVYAIVAARLGVD